MAETTTSVRVPLFFEVDLKGEMGEPGTVKLIVRGGRIIMEDGTVIGEIVFESPEHI